MTLHQESQHMVIPPELHCNLCDFNSNSMVILNVHIKEHHADKVSPILEPESPICLVIPSTSTCCHICGKVFSNLCETKKHVQLAHTSSRHECDPCDKTMISESSMVSHMNSIHCHSSPVSLPQIDGNVSLTDISYTGSDISRSDHLPPQVQNGNVPRNPQDLIFDYSLNAQKQSNRLITGAARPPISTTYNNLETINGVQHAFNATIECNSGVYLTAIKPALQAVTEGWSVDIGDWIALCTKVSDRMDNTGTHLLATQLKLKITGYQQNSDVSHQITIHFYHTNDKILIQSSSIITPGITAAVWFVKSFIEPLATSHITNNIEAIDKVNNDILSASVSSDNWLCNSCSMKVLPASAKVKDQPLNCIKCNNAIRFIIRGAQTEAELVAATGTRIHSSVLHAQFPQPQRQ